jgi:hypothetical protein
MAISLTKDEFYQRWSERHQILAIAIMEDIKNMPPIQFKITVGQAVNQTESLDISQPIGELLQKEIRRIIDLVYLEDLG